MTKTSLMLGLGETDSQVYQVMEGGLPGWTGDVFLASTCLFKPVFAYKHLLLYNDLQSVLYVCVWCDLITLYKMYILLDFYVFVMVRNDS